MFEVRREENGPLRLMGRLDATQSDSLRDACEAITGSCDVDLAELRYISSAGLGVLIATQRRLAGVGHGLRLVNANPHIRDLFNLVGLDHVFEIA